LSTAVILDIYTDNICTFYTSKLYVFTDVCTWTSNTRSGSWSTYLSSCSNTDVNVKVYNLGDAPTCQGKPNITIPLSITSPNDCIPFDNVYVKLRDTTCSSQNTSYNLLAHFQTDCKDGGIPFTIQLGEPYCQNNSFAPGFYNYDTIGSYSSPYYQMNVFNSTDGTCENQQTIYQTTSFPVECLAPVTSFNNIYMDIYNSFPISG